MGRGSDRASKGSRSSTGGSASSGRLQSLPSPARSPLTLSGPAQGASGGQGAVAQDAATHTDLAKLPAGFADGELEMDTMAHGAWHMAQCIHGRLAPEAPGALPHAATHPHVLRPCSHAASLQCPPPTLS